MQWVNKNKKKFLLNNMLNNHDLSPLTNSNMWFSIDYLLGLIVAKDKKIL